MPEAAARCSDMDGHLQAFLGDLLSDADYQAFVDHLRGCDACNRHARSIGDLSNQVWKLGKIPVPEDFSETVLFRARQSPAVETRGPTIAPIVPAIFFLLIGLAMAVFFVNRTFVSRPVSRTAPKVNASASAVAEPPSASSGFGGHSSYSERPTPASAAKKVPAQFPSANPFSDSVYEDVTLSAVTGAAGSVEGLSRTEEAGAPVPLPAVVPSPAVAPTEPPADQSGPLLAASGVFMHWHLVFNTDEAGLSVDEKKERYALLVAQAADLRRVQAETRNLENVQQPATTEAQLEHADRLKELEKETKRLSNEIQKLESTASAPKKPVPSARFSDALGALGFRAEAWAPEFFVFSVNDGEVEKLKESVLTRKLGVLREFSEGSPDAAAKRPCSVYVDRAGASGPHWHVGLKTQEQRTRLLDAVREAGGSVTEESGEILSFSLSRPAVEALRIRTSAMGLAFSEFGRVPPRAGVLGDSPVKITVYFTPDHA